MKTRHIIALAMALVCGLQVEGQGLWERFYKGWLTKPRNVDSTYIYQQHLGFTPSLTSNFSRQSIRMTTTDVLKDFPLWDEDLNPILDEEGNEVYSDLVLTVTDMMKEGISKRAGLFLGLGRLGAGWSFEMAPDSSQQSSTFLFSIRGNKFGLNINYLAFSQKIFEQFDCDPALFLNEGSIDTIAEGNRVQRLTVDGYYVFNTRRFAYPPGIAGNMVQLRSAGSWMLAGRYMQSNLDLNPEYTLASYKIAQFSLGCGYSYTWVPWSRQPKADGKGMRTFFVNGTIVPMLTFFNHLLMEPNDDFDGLINTNTLSIFCWPTPNILLNATVGYSWNNFYLGAQFNYNAFHFNTRNAISTKDLQTNDQVGTIGTLDQQLGVMGILYEWNVGLKFQACF